MSIEAVGVRRLNKEMAPGFQCLGQHRDQSIRMCDVFDDLVEDEQIHIAGNMDSFDRRGNRFNPLCNDWPQVRTGIIPADEVKPIAEVGFQQAEKAAVPTADVDDRSAVGNDPRQQGCFAPLNRVRPALTTGLRRSKRYGSYSGGYSRAIS